MQSYDYTNVGIRQKDHDKIRKIADHTKLHVNVVVSKLLELVQDIVDNPELLWQAIAKQKEKQYDNKNNRKTSKK